MQLQSILNGMLYALIGFGAGAVVMLAALGPLIVGNRRRTLGNQRRIERLERRQKTHGFAIRQLVEESIEPDDPEPPPHHRRDSRIFKGAAGIGVVALLGRVARHPVRAGLIATGATVGAAVLAVTLTPMQAQGGPSVSGLQAPSSPLASYTAPAVVPTVPSRSASASQAAPTSAIPPPVISSPATEAPQSTPSQPLLVVSLPPVQASVLLPPVTVLPTASLLPSSPVTLPSAPTPGPKGSATQACVLGLHVSPILGVCVP